MKSLCLLAGLFLVVGCTNRNHFQDPAYVPAKNISESFVVQKERASTIQDVITNETLLTADKAKISILKSALEKEFLLQTELILQPTAPQFSALQSRIVSFRERDNKIYLIETSAGHNFAVNLPQTILLAEFPIISESETQISFDFNKGMSKLFQGGDWKASDFSGRMPEASLVSLKVGFSYIEDARFSATNNLVIRQVAQLSIPSDSMDLPVEVYYTLSPYLENPNFHPTESPANFDRLAFFEVGSLINKDSGLTTYASKHDINKPIVYAISNNTPAAFKEAVKDGILYWNRALGQDLITVIDAPAGVTAPNPDYNVVQWVDWDSAGFAYADAQMDPRTGQILHHQIYFTSAWAKFGKIKARQLGQIPTSNNIKHQIGLIGFKPQQLCDMDLNQTVSTQVKTLLSKGLSETQTLKAAQDLIREVVAHEVGHTMGLRHNFAGSLAANYSLAQREELFKKYLETGSAPADLVTSSSVMDYQWPLESMLNGDQIAKGHPAADYDRRAIQTLYYGVQYADNEMPLFCTDSHSYFMMIPDCKPYDAGSSIVEWTQYQNHSHIKDFPYEILFTYQNAKSLIFGSQTIPVDKLAFDARTIAQAFLSGEKVLLDLFPANAQLLGNSRTFSYVNSTNQDIVREKMDQYLLSEFTKYNGFSKILLQTDLGFADREYSRFEALLDDADNLKGIDDNGKTFEFSAADVLVMKKNMKGFYKTLQAELIKQEAGLLAGNSTDPKMKAGELADTLADYLNDRANELLFTTTKSPLIIKQVGGGSSVIIEDKDDSNLPPSVITYSLPQFAYPYEVRQVAATFLRQNRSSALNWAFQQKVSLIKKYSNSLMTAFPPAATLPDASASTLQSFAGAPLPFIEWLQESLALKTLLNVN
jgi:hypothetical protein